MAGQEPWGGGADAPTELPAAPTMGVDPSQAPKGMNACAASTPEAECNQPSPGVEKTATFTAGAGGTPVGSQQGQGGLSWPDCPGEVPNPHPPIIRDKGQGQWEALLFILLHSWGWEE